MGDVVYKRLGVYKVSPLLYQTMTDASALRMTLSMLWHVKGAAIGAHRL